VAVQPVNIPNIFDRSLEEFGRRVHAVTDDQWDNSTPCTEWSVRDLVNHVVVEDLWAPGLLEGKTIDEIGGNDAFGGDRLGNDPKKAWDEAAAAAREAVHRDGAMEITTHLSFGDFPGSFYIQQLLADHVIHAWDLAKGIDGDDDLDDDLVRYVYEGLKPYADSLSAGGSFEPQIDVAEDADMETKLLAMAGRRR
jgi:uncharacterized protein (TIGR03086 family)